MTIHPVCVVLPGEVYRASALWRVVELGALIRRTPLDSAKPNGDGSAHHSGGTPKRARHSRGRESGQHMDALLSLVASKLSRQPSGEYRLWLEKRELVELLIILDEGLALLNTQSDSDSGTLLQREAIAGFLDGIRQQLPTPRKPARIQYATPHTNALVAAGGAD